MEENDGNMVRFRLVFDDRHLLNKLQRSQGLRHCWFLLKSGITTVGDLAIHIRESFGLRDRIVLFMDDFVLPSFESTCIITDKDIIRIKKDIKQKDIRKPCDGLNLLQDSDFARVHDLAFNDNLLADDKLQENPQDNGSHDKEILTSCMENAVHLDPTSSNSDLAKRKKKKLSKIKKKDIKQKDIRKPCDGLNLLQDSEIARVHDLAFNDNLLADDKLQENPQKNGSHDKEILTSCMENAVHLDPTSSDSDLAKRKKKKLSKSRSLLGESSLDGQNKNTENAFPQTTCFDKSFKKPFFDGESSLDGQNRNTENAFPHTTCFYKPIKVDEVPVADGLLSPPNPKVISSANNVTGPPKHLVHFENLLPLRRLPVKGDILAYRHVLSSSMHAMLSSPQVGKVSSFDYRSLQIILLPVLDYEILIEDNPNEAIAEQKASRFKEDGSLEIEYLSLVDVRLVKDDNNSEEGCEDDIWEALATANLKDHNSEEEQSNVWPKWIPNKGTTSTSLSFKQPNAPPLAVGRGKGRSNLGGKRCIMNNWIPNLKSTNMNPNLNNTNWNPNMNPNLNNTNWNPNMNPSWPYSYRAPRPPPPLYPRHQNNIILPGGGAEFYAPGNQ